MYDCLIFEGGGVKGVSYIGAIECLSELDILKNIKKFGGSSAGSQVAALLALGYNAQEFKEILLNTPLHKFKDSGCGCCRDLYRFFKYFGYYKGEFMLEYFDELVEAKLGKPDATFQDLYNCNQNHLRITGTCLETESLEIFDHIETPNMPISKAMYISSCIPFFFKPVKHNNKTYVDGGCLRNLPINLFDNDNEYDNCLAFELVSKEKKDNSIKCLKDFTFSLMNTIHTAANRVEVKNDKITQIQINTGDVSAFDFDLKPDQEELLINNGYDITKQKLTHTAFV